MMMKLSQRVQRLLPSPIRKLTPYAEAAKAAGKKVYHLNIGQPDIPTPPAFMEAVKAYDAKVLAYGNSKGEPALIAAIRNYYAQLGMAYAPEDIFITNGGSEALFFAVQALCDEGDEILIFEPFYANYSTFATQAGAVLRPVPTSVDTGYHLPGREVIEQYITPRTKALILTNPGNPTGVVYTPEEQELVASLVLRHDLALIADEVYREFVYDGEYRSFGSMKELEQNLILIDSISKRYSACGARIGCLISKNKALGRELLKCCQGRLCCPALEQVGAAALYTTPPAYLQAVKAEYKQRRDVLEAALAKLPGVKASEPKGAFYVMVSLPVDDAEKFAIWLLESYALDQETVMIAPGNGFYSTPGCGSREARLAYVLNSRDLERAIYILGQALQAYPGALKL